MKHHNYKRHKLNPNRWVSYIDSPDGAKPKEVTTNPLIKKIYSHSTKNNKNVKVLQINKTGKE